MGVKWTEEQQQVIDLRDHNILVSAAAGSGKTAVLVERIIARLTRDANPVDVDHMLIVTYTEAAAAEMKERIGAAIEKELEEDPSSEHLKRQSALIHTAKITTIHSFCLSVIREYFHTIDLDPGFRIAEEGELKLLKQDVMKELLEAKYEEGNEDFLRFVETFATGREDLQVEEIISRLYEFAGSYPDPEEWLDDCARMYEERGEKAIYIEKVMEYIWRTVADMQMPERFDLEYVGADGEKHRPVMIHRVVLGSIERFIGVITEHFAGAFPTWLAPVQVKVLAMTDRTHEAAKQIADSLDKLGIRVETDLRNEKIGFKIREAQMQRIPYMLIIGDKEVENNVVAVRSRKGGDLGTMPLAAFEEKLMEEVKTRSISECVTK